jgi:methyl-accepting chemotaxis protein
LTFFSIFQQQIINVLLTSFVFENYHVLIQSPNREPGMKLLQQTIAGRLALGFSLLTVLMLAIAVTGASQTGRIADHIRLVNQDYYPKTVLADTIKSNLNIIERSIRNLLFVTVAADVEREMRAIGSAQADIAKALDRFSKLDRQGEGRQLLAAVIAARTAYQPALDGFLQLVRTGEIEQARDLNLPDMVPLQQRYFAVLDQLIAHQGREMDAAGRQAENAAVLARTMMMALAGVAIGLAVAVGFGITHRITGPLREAVALARRVADGDLSGRIGAVSADETGQLLAALADMNDSLARTVSRVRDGTDEIHLVSSEIATGNADLSMRTEGQASSLEQMVGTLDTLTAAVRANAASADEARKLAGAASDIAGSGDAMVMRMTVNMETIAEAANRIADITSVIDGIAFQTNILALNAAVEAARAGEHGRGFAVVASEVRNLAQRSAVAAREIRVLTGDSSAKVEEGSRLAAGTGETMRRMLSAVQALTQAMNDIATASEDQRRDIENVNQALVRMDGMTQQNAALVEEAAAAASSLQHQAEKLTQAVSVFRLPQQEAGASRRPPRDAAVRQATLSVPSFTSQ